MKRVTLSKACPPMPQAFHDHITATLERLEEREMPNKKVSALLIAALIGALLLAGLAYAATQSGILSDLFGGKAPSEAAQQLLVQPGKSAEQSGVRLTVDEYLLDGNLLHMTCTFTSASDEPLVCGMNWPKVNGATVAGGTFSQGVGMDALVALKKNAPITVRMSAILREDVDASRPVSISLTGYALAPLTDLARFRDDFSVSDISTVHAAVVTQVMGSSAESLSPDTQNPVYLLWTEEASALFMKDEAQTQAEVYEKLGYARTVATLPLEISVSAETLKAAVHTAVDGKDTFDFPEYTLKVVRADFGAASTMVELHLYPKRPFKEYDEDMNNDDPLIDRAYALLTPDGKELTAALTGGWDGGVMQAGEENGEPLHYCWKGDGNPIDAPETVTFAPYIWSTDDWGKPHDYLSGEAVTVVLKK